MPNIIKPINMKKFRTFHLYLFLVSIFVFSANNPVFAQLTIVTPTAGTTPQQLVQSVLLGGGVTVSNVTFNGSPAAITSNQIGSFTTGFTPTNLGIASGLLLSSGGINGMAGPNNSGSTTTAITGTSMTDPQLQALVPGQLIKDASVLEFDFLPLSDTIKFKYVFGSEEYMEYVNTNYNDVFGFFITGQNPNGPAYVNKNIALIPNSTLPITIDNVNANSNAQYYVSNISGGPVQFDGFTVVLTALAIVVPCTPYHIKLAVGDRSDNAFDSGVFLEANSFSTNAITITTNYSSVNATPMAIEGCNNAIIKFKIPAVKTDTVFLPLIISGTAINGTDYQLIPNMVHILPGQLSKTITIIPISDGIAEPIETIFIKVHDTTSCALLGDSTIIEILSRDSILLTPSHDTSICQTFLPQPAFSVPVSVSATGGAGALSYTWFPASFLNSDTIPNAVSTPGATTLYTVNVKDNTGCPGSTASVTVIVNAQPDVSFTSTPFLPAKGCAPMTVTFNDETSPAAAIRTWDFGDGTTSSDSVPTHVYSIPGTYGIKLSIITAGGCKGEYISQTDAITIYSQPIANFTWNPPIGTRTNPMINFVNLTTPVDPSFLWSWNFGDNTATSDSMHPSHSYPSIPEEKIYTVTLIATSNFGCNDTITYYDVKIIDDVLVFPNILTPNGDNINDKFEIGALIIGGGYTETQVIIYNRWGKKVYESTNYQNDFDGKGLPDGVYFVTIKAKGILKDVEYKSSLQILR
jgi:gliding motility-associated-like protein